MNKSSIIKHVSLAAAAALVTLYYCFSQEILTATLVQKYLILTDGFTVPGVLLLCVGLLCKISTLGALDGLLFGLKAAFTLLIPGAAAKEQETFSEYVERKKEKRITGYEFIIHVGILFIAIALIFMVLFYQIYEA